ncbi:MAG: hypothetical protein M1813_000706 [Trichoglossum hirsutum]|nr:MAG: hypothetical protein M1813_000706 [Trichoglossum hirsutum]
MESFMKSCDAAAEYPRNLIYHNTYDYNLEAYVKRLDERESDLFSIESKASLDFWDFNEQEQEFMPFCIRSAIELEKKLRVGAMSVRRDPRCRFIFVHAPSSRERLRTTREMLMLSLTYHQVMPSYLDFLFPFGKQVYQQDFYFSGFRHENRLSNSEKGLRVPELGRSGRVLQLCYSLKSVERWEGNPERPWSIRQTAVYHSFDTEAGVATWILAKGNELMKNRVQSATGSHALSELTSFGTIDGAIAATLAAHLIFCDWSGENWRWYVNFLEEELQNKTRQVLLPTVDGLTSPALEKNVFEGIELMAPPMLPSAPPSPEISRRPVRRRGTNDQQDFSFSQLQRIQYIEDKANETLLVIKANISVLSELKRCYQSIFDSKDFLGESAVRCKVDYARFESRITSVENDLQVQQSRLYGLLEYRCLEASKLLAQKAQQSADNMENMTRDMHAIARKTKQETVSMRIITLVTLFFLPGTFISSYQTLMSTDIIRFQTDQTGEPSRTFRLGALQLFLAITVPLMFVSFLAWYGVYWWVDRKDKVKLIF